MNAIITSFLIIFIIINNILYVHSKLTRTQEQEVLDAHNKFRALTAAGKTPGPSGVQPAAGNIKRLVWSKQLARKAQRLADGCVFKHDSPSDRQIPEFGYVGQNVAAWNTGKNDADVAGGVKIFYNEAARYDYWQNNCKSGKCGHYTQVVWASTTKVGCALAKCGKKVWYMFVCNYGPGGNYGGVKPYKAGHACTRCPRNTYCEAKLCVPN